MKSGLKILIVGWFMVIAPAVGSPQAERLRVGLKAIGMREPIRKFGTLLPMLAAK